MTLMIAQIQAEHAAAQAAAQAGVPAEAEMGNNGAVGA